MAKIRVIAFVIGILIVGIVGTFFAFYARGYRFNTQTLNFKPNGILVIKSEPDGASVFINGELKTATNATISLSPGVYDVEVRRDGYFSWYKRLTIDKEIVTQATVSLFRNVPSLSPTTFSGASNPVMSPDGGKIAYSVLPGEGITSDKLGLWTLDTFSLPLGFSNDPRRITDGNLINTTYTFSPNGRQIMLTTSNGIFVLDAGSYTAQNQMINVASQEETILAQWKKEETTKNTSLTRNLPEALNEILTRRTNNFIFSPDEQMILYSASTSGTLPDNLIRQLPGASTQKQERNIQAGSTYIYDIKEDRNFKITDQPVIIGEKLTEKSSVIPALRWMSSSRHLLLASPGQIVVMDYDGTNKETVYSGSYINTYAFPFNNTTRLLILTNLGAENTPANLYTLTIK